VTVAEMDILTMDIDAELARRSLAEFVRQSWHVLEPGVLDWGWHLDAMCSHIQAVFEGWEEARDTGAKPAIQNLLINVPPGSAKSRILSVCSPAWMWLRCPAWRVICISANPRVALRDAVYCRQLVESDWYRQTFRPKWEMSEDQNAKGLFRNTEGGYRMSIGVGAKITGDRGDCLIVDDPHDAAEVESDTIREGVLDWWDKAASNRVNDLRISTRIGIMQRLHEADWAGHNLASGEWEHVCIRQEFEPGKAKLRPVDHPGGKKLAWVDEATAIGWRDPRAVENELMFPARFPATVVNKEKRRLGSAGYSGQHQQDPTAADGNAFKRAWFQYFEDAGDHYLLHGRNGDRRVLKRECRKRFGTGDYAFSTKESADYTVIAMWDVTPLGEVLLIDLVRARLEDPDAERMTETMYRRHRPLYIGIENKQNGATILQRLARKGTVRTRALDADTDKKTRAATAIIDMENGLFFFPASAPWLAEYETELLRFPNGSHDDQVDVTSYAAIEKAGALVPITDWGTVTAATSHDASTYV
jgi:predicted phage terminase large subunit-like protein